MTQTAAAAYCPARDVEVGLALAYLGKKAEAVREGEECLALPITQQPYPEFVNYVQHQLVRIHILVGNHERALDLLEPLLRRPNLLTPAAHRPQLRPAAGQSPLREARARGVTAAPAHRRPRKRPFETANIPDMILALLLALATAATTPADLGPVPNDAVRVYLVRHGQAFSNLDPEPELPPEQLDRLTELGHAQSKGAAEALREAHVTRIVSSPAGRARETAEDLRSALGVVAVVIDPRIRSLEVGLNPKGEADDWDWRSAEWEAGRDPKPPKGESMQQMGERVLAAVRALRTGHKGQSVVLVAHSEVIGAFVGALDGTPAAKRYPPKIRNASITVVEAGAGPMPKLIFSNYLAPGPAAAP